MKRIFTLGILILIGLSGQSQCYSRNGIMNEACSSLTIIDPPALEISIGQGIHDVNLFRNVTQLSVNYITKDEIVYGISFGVRPYGHPLDHISTNILLGYNVAGCIMLGVTVGRTNITTIRINNEVEPVIYQGWHTNVGMTMKVTSGRTTFGAYGSSTGIGLTIGRIL